MDVRPFKKSSTREKVRNWHLKKNEVQAWGLAGRRQLMVKSSSQRGNRHQSERPVARGLGHDGLRWLQ